jgi:hypothetical protein
VGIQPYSPSHGISPLLKADAPTASRLSRSPGSSASAQRNPRCSSTCAWRPCGTPLRVSGAAGSTSLSMIMVGAPDWAAAAAASSPARLAPITTTPMATG